jgi:hypothetical protein
MTAVIRKNRIHIFIWALMFAYITFSVNLHTHFFLKYGKPIRIDKSLPQETMQIKFTVDDLDPIILEGQEMYQLWGWAFSTADANMAPDAYEREIILVSNSEIYIFPIHNVKRQGVQDVYKDLNMNLIFSGFSTYISKDVLPFGEYRVGIVFRDPSTGSTYYTDKPKIIIHRTPNRLSLTK